jgi:hypothetical protein
MIKEIKFYSIECDCCKNLCDSRIDLGPALLCAFDSDWIEHEEKHYCPKCYSIGENDKVVINETRKQ